MPRVVIERVNGEGYCVVCRRRIMGRHVMSSLFSDSKAFEGDLRVCEDCHRRIGMAFEGLAQEVELVGMVDPDNPPESREREKPVVRGQQSLRVAL